MLIRQDTSKHALEAPSGVGSGSARFGQWRFNGCITYFWPAKILLSEREIWIWERDGGSSTWILLAPLPLPLSPLLPACIVENFARNALTIAFPEEGPFSSNSLVEGSVGRALSKGLVVAFKPFP